MVDKRPRPLAAIDLGAFDQHLKLVLVCWLNSLKRRGSLFNIER
jgi:hypothetical protein